MKVVHEVYDFITGGSLVTPIGLIVAILCARFGPAVFLAVVLATFVASTLERVA